MSPPLHSIYHNSNPFFCSSVPLENKEDDYRNTLAKITCTIKKYLANKILLSLVIFVLAVLITLIYQQIFNILTPSDVTIHEQYANCLRSKIYSRLQPTSSHGKQPRTPKRPSYISLTAVKLDITTKREADAFVSDYLFGSPKKAKKAIPIDLEEFLTPVSDQPLKFVLIEGAPGVGKSTFVKEITQQWSKFRAAYLTNYTIVILVSLRDTQFQEARQLDDLYLTNPCQYHINMTQLKLNINITNGAGVLWILDGFDELPAWQSESMSIYHHLIEGTILPDATVLVTTRPTSSQHLLEYLNELNAKRIEIVGFNNETIEQYAKEYFKTQHEIFSQFLDFYRLNPMIENMMYIPLNCLIVCMIYEENYSENKIVPTTMTELYNTLVRTLIRRYLEDLKLKLKIPTRLMFTEDFKVLPPGTSNTFYQLTEMAYNGVLHGKYIFDINLEHSFGFMTTVVSFSATENKYTTSFLHKTLQEYMAAIYFTNTSTQISTDISDKVLEAILPFIVGIVSTQQNVFDNITLSIFRKVMKEFKCDLVIRCLYESPQLMDLVSHLETSKLHHCGRFIMVSSPLTFDYFIMGYLIAHYKISFKVDFKSRYALEAFVKGIQSEPKPQGVLFNSELTLYMDDVNLISLLNKLPRLLLSGLQFLELDILDMSNIDLHYFLHNTTLLNKTLVTFQNTSLQSLIMMPPIILSCKDFCKYIVTLKNLTKLTFLMIGTEDEMPMLLKIIAPESPIRDLSLSMFVIGNISLYQLLYPSSLKILRLSCLNPSNSFQCAMIDSKLISKNTNLNNLTISVNCPCFESILSNLVKTQLKSLQIDAPLNKRHKILNIPVIIDIIQFSYTLQKIALNYKPPNNETEQIIEAANHNPTLKTLEFAYPDAFSKEEKQKLKKLSKKITFREPLFSLIKQVNESFKLTNN